MACSLETKLPLIEREAEAQAVDLETKGCAGTFDCRAINQDCCGEESGFIVVNRSTARRLTQKISEDCAKKKAQAEADKKNLCQDKKPSAKYPKVACEGGMCAIKAKPAEDKSGCTYSAQCDVFDPDCCNASASVMAINFRFGAEERENKQKTCRPKFEADPGMCRGMKAPSLKKRTVACVEGKCQIK